MKHVWTLDEAPARAGRRPGALAEYKALRDASCVWRPAVLSHKLLILRNDGQTEVEGTHVTECVVDAPSCGLDRSNLGSIRFHSSGCVAMEERQESGGDCHEPVSSGCSLTHR